jgi:hypothetical protein
MKKIVQIVMLAALSNNAIAQDINFTEKELYPEGIAYDAQDDVYFVSSLHYGKIGKVKSDGTYSTFITDDELVSAIGIHIHPTNKLLYVCVSDPGVAVNTNASTQMKLAKVIAFDIKTGKKVFVADLGALNAKAANFANDLDFDKAGNAYITNSASPIIYKITPKGKASIFATNDAWTKEGFNLNGIVCHPNGYLLAVQSNTGELYKINLKNPKAITKVKTDLFTGGDGLVRNSNNKLLIISNSKKEVYQLVSTDNFTSAKVSNTAATQMDFPTTGVFVKGKYRVLNAKLNEIFNPNATKTSNFLIQEFEF